MKMPALLKLKDGQPRKCRACSTEFVPPKLTGEPVQWVTCFGCLGYGCKACAPVNPPVRPGCAPSSGRGCGRVHSPECNCWQCQDLELPKPHEMQTCGHAECVEAWRRSLGSGKPIKPRSRRDERSPRDMLLDAASMPPRFRAPYDRTMLNGGRGARVVLKTKVDGAVVRIRQDLFDHMTGAEFPHCYIWGPFQIGKSRTAAWCLEQAINLGASGLFLTTANLSQALSKNRLGTECPLVERAMKVTALVLDDLFLAGQEGRGHRSKEAEDSVTAILQHRWNYGLFTLATSPYPPAPRDGHPDEPSLKTLLGWYYERIQQGSQLAVLPP